MSDEMLKLFPFQYQDGPDYCEVKDANGASFALTMRPDVMKAMEFALRAAASAEPVAWRHKHFPNEDWQYRENQTFGTPYPFYEPLYTRPAPDAYTQAEMDEADREADEIHSALFAAPDAEIVAALEPFVSLRDQAVSQTVRIINKGMDGLTPVTVTVTKDQFRAALTALAKAKGGSAAGGVD